MSDVATGSGSPERSQVLGRQAGKDLMHTFYDTLRIQENACPPGCTACREKCLVVKGADGIQELHHSALKVHTAIACNQCSEPACVEVCPTGAIAKSAEDGIVRIAGAKCLGCGLCDLACPYGGIRFNPAAKKASKCDLCDGDPACRDACPVGAISILKARALTRHFHEDPFLSGSPLCGGCAAETALRFVMKMMGKDTFLFGAPGCACNMFNGMGTKSMCRVPSHMSNMTSVPSTMAGVKRYYRKQGKDVRCVAFVGDGCATDVGFQPLSGAAERNENIIFITYDNEGYMNTGIQRSSTTPYMGWTTTTPVTGRRKGKRMPSKNVPLIMAAHGIPYVATATIGFPEDFAGKLLKAMAVRDGMSYIHLLSPCILGWGYGISKSLDICRAAVETNYFPLWECDRGVYRVTHSVPRARPAAEYLALLKKFSHLDETDEKEFQRLVDERFARLKGLTGLAQEVTSSRPG
jgi:phenylglyoxylate dehydrogenase beta subunit